MKTSRKNSLVSSLFPEVFQTERSARVHPAKEAKRLGKCPPSAAFLAVSAHAKASEKTLTKLARARGCRPSILGQALGDLFSVSRNRIADLGTSTEQSYRGTLLGMHHGVDVMTLMSRAADEEQDAELSSWCDAWLQKRRPLVQAAVDALAWFAKNPDVARSNAKSPSKR